MADIDVCFWCLKPFKDDEEFHKGEDRMVLRGFKPCKKCEEIFSHGIRLTGVVDKQPIQGMPPITVTPDGKELYPTGTMFLASEDIVRAMLSDPDEKETLDSVLEAKMMLMPEENVQNIIDMMKENDVGSPLTEETLDENAEMETEKVENKLGIPIV